MAKRSSGFAGLILTSASLVFACSDSAPRSHRLDAAEAPAEPSYDEWLREQLRLRITIVDSDGERVEEAAPDSVINDAYISCLNSVNPDQYGSTCSYTYAINALVPICEARTLLATATAQSDPVTISPWQGITHHYDRVTEANASQLATWASELARSALEFSLNYLKAPPTTAPFGCKLSGAWVLGPTGRVISQDFASSAVDAYYVAMAATERAVEATLNASDAARSSSRSPQKVMENSVVGPLLSRAAAAHLLVGGDAGLTGSTKQGYCVGPELAPQARSALQLLRDSGISPAALKAASNTTLLQALLNSNTGTTAVAPFTVPSDGSVRQRLGAFYGIAELNANVPVESYYSLDERDFEQARLYLLQEQAVFGRSQTAKFPLKSGYARYAGSAGEQVPALPPGAWEARARYHATTPIWATMVPGRWVMAPNGANPSTVAFATTRPGLDVLVAGTHLAVRDLIKSTDHFNSTAGTPPNAVSKEVLGVLGSILTSEQYKGTLNLQLGTGYIMARAYGYAAADGLRVVVGEDGLRCATEGTIEGARCDDGLLSAGQAVGAVYPCPASEPATLSCLTASDLTTNTTGTETYGVTTWASAPTRSFSTVPLLLAKTRLYFVRLKQTGLDLKPGNFEYVGGLVPTVGNQYAPVIQGLDRRVAEVLAPNRRHCDAPTTNCLGVAMDARLPLEDELSDNGDGVENSWKHYLGLARQSANESDLLGKEFRDAKLNKLQGEALAAQRKEDQFQAAENAIQEVQASCGTAVDGRRIVELLSGGSGQSNLDEVVSTTATCPACDASTTCTAGKCIKSLTYLLSGLSSEPDQRRLQSCLDESTSAVVPFVTLGDKELCVYVRTGTPTDVCPSDLMGSQACPDVKPVTGCPVAPSGTYSVTAKALGYYKNHALPKSTACQLLRKVRGSHDPADLEALVSTNVLQPGRLADRIGRLGFEAHYGGYFTITEDGAPRWTSGNIAQGKGTGWPWSTVPGCAPGDVGLFCSSLVPGTATPQQIGAMNQRVLKAALVAAYAREPATGQVGGLSVVYPVAVDAAASKGYFHDACTRPGNVASTLYKNNTAPIRACADSHKLSGGETWLVGTTYRWLGTGSDTAWINADGSTMLTSSTTPVNFLGPRSYSYENARVQFALTSVAMDLNPLFGGLSDVGSGALAFPIIVPWEEAEPHVKNALLGDDSETEHDILIVEDGDADALKSILGAASGVTLRADAALDGLEMLCEMERAHSDSSAQPPALTASSDIEQAGAYLQSIGERLNAQAANLIFANVPALASSALGDVPATGSFPALSGEMGEAVASLRGGLVATRSAMPVIAGALQQMGAEMQTLRSQLDIHETQKQLVNLNTMSATLAQINSCAQSALNPASWVTYGAATAVECVHGAAQIAIAVKEGALREDIENESIKIARQGFAQRMSQLSESLAHAALGLEQAAETVNGSLSRIDGLRKRARLNLAKASYLASYQSEQQAIYDTSVGRLATQAQDRYLVALRNAKLMSFYAKRAIEQRLGMRLSEMRDALPLVDAPQSWEGRVCSMGGTKLDTDDWVAAYGEGFIGDYVTQLENVVESYRLTNNFHEGRDVAVISLRDDVANVRKPCEVPSRNLLSSSADLSAVGSWTARTCTAQTVGGVTYSALNCIAAAPTPDIVAAGGALQPDLAVRGLTGSLKGAQGFALRFGDGKNCDGTNGPCGWKTGSALSQMVQLRPGRYRLSWYTRDTVTSGVVNGASEGIAVVRGGTTAPALVASSFIFPHPGLGAGAGWQRASVEYTIAKDGAYEVGFGVTAVSRPTYQVTIAAPMLDSVPFDGAASLLPAFQATSASGLTSFNDCEDTNGDLFRLKSWRRECTHLCDTGFSGNCDTGPEYCYREFSFGVSQPWIQNGKLFKYSGFARGNFNYRIESLGLNFVGSSVRNCDNETLSSTCYNAGFVPYSLAHDGPFFVRNDSGGDFKAELFDGRIEHARGLALERYLTNPISSTDRELLADYMRTEFAGRPLDGNFALRIWEEPGVDFDAIEDVQLILNYRYWTAFD
jgi:hypothetical protein